MRLACVFVPLGLGLLLAPPGGAASGAVYAQESSFGRLGMPATAEYAGGPVTLQATMVFREGSGVENATYLVFGFNVPSSAPKVAFASFTRADGSPMPFLRDERRDDPQQPRFVLDPTHLPPAGTPIHMRASVEVPTNGQFHVGAIVMAFDESWEKLETPAGDPGELYAFSMVRAEGMTGSPWEPPFVGKGNVPGAGLAVILVAACVAAFARRHGWSS